MKILVTGANGFLGQHFIHHFSKTSHTIIATGRGTCRLPESFTAAYHSLDITDSQAVNDLILQTKPDIIVHLAAMSRPDACHHNREECYKQNVSATLHLTDSFKKIISDRSLFVYLSTDFVFGENGPHSEDDSKEPLNIYGASKLESEQLVEASGLPFTIVRPVLIYGPVWEGLRNDFIHWVKTSLEAGKKIKVVSDQLRTPTYVYDICRGLQTIIEQKKTGTYHLAGKELISPYIMAVTTARLLSLNENLIENVTSDTFTELVIRSKSSGLKIDKAKTALNYNPVSFEEGIRLTFLAERSKYAN